MAITRFNAYGLLPAGFHSVTLLELEQKLGFSPKRRSLIEEGLKPLMKELLDLGIGFLYIGGSFVTEKLSPDDVDGYCLVDLGSKAYQVIVERQEIWQTRYRMDIHPALTDIEGYGSKIYWEDWFSKTAEDLPKLKGIVKLLLKE